MVILPKVVNEITSEFSYILHRGKKILKYTWELKDPWIAKVILIVILIKELLIKKSNTGNNTEQTSNSTEDP